MEITYVGHACFLIKLSTGYSICFDPYASGSVPGLSDTDIVADSVNCSHKHSDHYDFDSVGAPEKPYAGDLPEFEYIASFHDEVQGAKRGTNTITVVTSAADNAKIVHMGDIGCDLTDEQLSKIRGCDLLLIPVGGFFTIDCKKAFEMTCLIDPKVVVPMHFRGASFGYDQIGGREEFVELIKSKGDRKIVEAGSVISDLPDVKTLLLMDPLRIL